MPTTRTVKRTSATANRRRDRAAAPPEDVDEEEDEDLDVTERPKRRRSSTKSTVVKRNRYDDEDEDEEEDLDEEDLDEEDEDLDEEEEDEDDEEEPPPPRRTKKAAAKKATTRRRPPPEPDEDDEEEEDEPPRRTRARAAKSTTKKTAGKKAAPLGVKSGFSGVEEVTSFGNINRLKLDDKPQLFKALEKEPFAVFGQHWVRSRDSRGDRPYTCIGPKICPLCAVGDRPTGSIMHNVLHLSADEEPSVKALQVGRKAFEAYKELATSKVNGQILFEKELWSVNRSGKRQQTQTNFHKVKLRDVEDEWPEVLSFFDLEELPTLVAEAKTELYTVDDVQVSTKAELKEVARFLVGDEDDDEEEDDD